MSLETTIYSDNDIHFVDGANANTNYNAIDSVGAGNDSDSPDTFRSAIKFTFTSLPAGISIVSATLRCVVRFNTASNIRTHRIYKITSDWDKTTVTWNTQPSYTTELGATSIGTAPSIGSNIDWTLTASEIAGYYLGTTTNYGFFMKADTESDDTHEYWSSRNGTASNRPQLIITYNPPTRRSQFV